MSNYRGVPEMLAPLAVYLSIMLIICTLLLMVIWAHDTVGQRLEGRGAHPAEPAFPVHSRPRARERIESKIPNA